MNATQAAERAWDVVIAGGGNAALCAAIEAAETGASVLILEGAPKAYRGGNSRHTRNFRCMHHGALGPLVVADGIVGSEDGVRSRDSAIDHRMPCPRSERPCPIFR